jgi:aminoglycoside phosphotransferase (APT) family kinase protein
MFLRKADVTIDDDALRQLARRNPERAAARVPDIVALLSSTLGKPAQVAPLASQGTFHLVHRAKLYSGQHLIIRSSLTELFERDDSLLIEQTVLPFLTAVGLSIPAVHVVSVGARDRVPFDYAIADEAPGQVVQGLSEPAKENPELWRSVGAALRRVHTISGQGFGALLSEHGGRRLQGCLSQWNEHLLCNSDAHIDRCRKLGLLDADEASEAVRCLADVGQKVQCVPALLHGDLGNHNVFIDSKMMPTLVDWEDAILGDPVFDLAMWATFNPSRRHAAFFEGYGAATDDQRFRVVVSVYFLRITLAKAVVRHRFGYPDAPDRPTIRQRVSSGLAAVRRAMENRRGAIFN